MVAMECKGRRACAGLGLLLFACGSEKREESAPASTPSISTERVAAERSRPSNPSPVAPSNSVAGPSVMPDRVAQFGPGWYCIKSISVENMSTCFKSEKQCEVGREKFTTGELRYAGCVPQDVASCFTYRSRLQSKETFDCSATIAACERQRAYALAEMRSDVEDVHDCTPWGAPNATQATRSKNADNQPTKTGRWGGDEIYCSDFTANGETIGRYFCQFLASDCDLGADGTEKSAEKTYAKQGQTVNVTMGRCKRSTEETYCGRMDAGYFCSGRRDVCDAVMERALQSNKVDTVSRCKEWRPGVTF